MPFLAPAIPAIIGGLSAIGGGSAAAGAAGLAGTALSALGRGGKQAGQASTGRSTQSQDITERVKETELPELTAFRNTLFPAFGQALADAQAPLFSENAQAAFLGRLNDTSNKAIDAISGNLARRGALNSGALGSAFTDVELSRNRDITDFLTQLPLLEREAKFSALTPLLQLGLGFAGTGPRDVTSTRTGSTTTESAGNVDVNGPGFLRALAGEGSDILSLILSGRFGGGSNVPRYELPTQNAPQPTALEGVDYSIGDPALRAVLGLS